MIYFRIVVCKMSAVVVVWNVAMSHWASLCQRPTIRWCLRLVETSVEASDDGECSGEPRDLRESLEPSIVRIGLETYRSYE